MTGDASWGHMLAPSAGVGDRLAGTRLQLRRSGRGGPRLLDEPQETEGRQEGAFWEVREGFDRAGTERRRGLGVGGPRGSRRLTATMRAA